MRVQKSLIAGMLAGPLAFSAAPAFALAWDWPYPWADPKPAIQDGSAVRGESDATESDRRQFEFASSRGLVEKNRSRIVGDKNALRGNRRDLDRDRARVDRDGRDR